MSFLCFLLSALLWESVSEIQKICGPLTALTELFLPLHDVLCEVHTPSSVTVPKMDWDAVQALGLKTTVQTISCTELQMLELSQQSQNLCFGPRDFLLFLNRFSLLLLFIPNGVAALWDSSLQYSPCWLAWVAAVCWAALVPEPYRDVPVNKEVPTLLVVLGGSLIHSAYSHHSWHGQRQLRF